MRLRGAGQRQHAAQLLRHRHRLLDFTVDRNPYKHGRFTPGMHIPIHPVEAIDAAKPDYLLILAWNLRTEIVAQMRHVTGWGAVRGADPDGRGHRRRGVRLCSARARGLRPTGQCGTIHGVVWTCRPARAFECARQQRRDIRRRPGLAQRRDGGRGEREGDAGAEFGSNVW